MADLSHQLVSVLMPSFNHERFVEEAVRSVWAQTHRDVELIVIDDCSTDGTFDRLLSLERASPIPMRVERTAKNAGIGAALNRALTLARGSWIGILASDDAFMPEKLEVQLRDLGERGSSYLASHCDAWAVDAQGAQLYRVYERTLVPPMLEDAFVDFAFAQARVIAVSVVVETALARAAGGFDEAIWAEDFDFNLRVARKTKYAFINQPLVLSRVLPTSLGRTPSKFIDSAMAALQKQRAELGEYFDGAVQALNLSAVDAYARNGPFSAAVRHARQAVLPTAPPRGLARGQVLSRLVRTLGREAAFRSLQAALPQVAFDVLRSFVRRAR